MQGLLPEKWTGRLQRTVRRTRRRLESESAVAVFGALVTGLLLLVVVLAWSVAGAVARASLSAAVLGTSARIARAPAGRADASPAVTRRPPRIAR
jgi:hypothetical protein